MGDAQQMRVVAVERRFICLMISRGVLNSFAVGVDLVTIAAGLLAVRRADCGIRFIPLYPIEASIGKALGGMSRSILS
ncbi:MAG: hypothetical protein KDK99_16740 [Verrucomicrobiales bacterium]|nr:hypothetical protein [Verrucomicrobiales bacterium]